MTTQEHKRLPEPRVVTVTPEMAADALGRNTHNRRPSTERIQRYAKDMAAGKWRVTHQPVAFAGTLEKGVLLDGQNRLAAVIRSKTPTAMAVVEYADPDTFADIDTGRPRTLRDLLDIRGVPGATQMAAMVNWLYRLNHRTARGMPFGGSPTPRVGLELYDREPAEALRHSYLIGRRLRDAIRGPAGLYSALHYLYAGIDYQDAAAFFERLRTGENLGTDDPILRLREFLIQSTARATPHSRYRPEYLCAVMTKAWNLFREGKTTRRLYWTPGGAKPEDFPIPH